jgi:hypothetical protein
MKMKTLVAFVALSAVVAGPAFAQSPSRNHAFHQQHVDRSNLYQSDAQGNQPYPNPDRELYVNRTCC